MYKYLGIGMLGFFIFMMIPGIDQTIEQSKMYGVATLVAYDLERNEMFAQTVHNRLVDTGEDLINDNVFSDGNASTADADAVGSICAYEDGGTTIASLDVEGTTAANFDTGNQNGSTECVTDTGVDTTGASTAVIGPLTFTGGTNVDTLGTVNGIGVCNAENADAAFNDCATEGALFAIVNTSDVTLGAGETVDITYTFSLVSPSN
ncbi:MAG: hypothetical protein V3T67_01625 [Nitrosopumilaceae archaeon]